MRKFPLALFLGLYWIVVVGAVGHYNEFLPGQDRAASAACQAPKPGMIGCRAPGK